MEGTIGNRPKVAIIDPNTLAAVGLKQLLQNVMPIMTIDTFGTFAELEANHPDNYYHYFVAMNIVLENRVKRNWFTRSSCFNNMPIPRERTFPPYPMCYNRKY